MERGRGPGPLRWLAQAALLAAPAHSTWLAPSSAARPLLLAACPAPARPTPAHPQRAPPQAASSSMVCCAAFDRDDELFATVGVAKRIRIYEISSLVASSANPVLGSCQYPVLEISSRSRLSSVCWSSYIKAHLACSDYEGVVQLWDTNANSEVRGGEGRGGRVTACTVAVCAPCLLRLHRPCGCCLPGTCS